MSESAPERTWIEKLAPALVDAIPGGIIVVDSVGAIVFVNSSAERIFGYSRASLMGKPVHVLVPESLRELHEQQVHGYGQDRRSRAMRGGRELTGVKADGSTVRLEIGIHPIDTPEGQFTMASILDVTGIPAQAIRSARLAAIVESSEDAIVSKSLDGVILSWNAGAEHLFGYSAAEAIGQSILLVIPERLHEDEARIMQKLLRRERFQQFDTVRLRKDGTEVPVSITVSPLINSSGDIVGGAKIARDITDLKRRDEELRRSNAALQEFAYVASHDLQEPLRMVANYTELLAERYRGRLDEKADLYIHHASDGARRMQRLVSDLLAYSRIGSQGRPLAPVDAEAVFKRVVISLGPLITETGCEIVHEPLPSVLADEVQLQQLLQNLVGNAIKFRGEKPPRIEVRVARSGGMWRFTLADNGIGMDPKFADRVFLMFQRLHPVGTYEGSGIGLSIAKRIVERHGGRIWFDSTPAVGTTFSFTLRPAEEGTR